MNMQKTDNLMYKITLQIILVKWKMIQNDINKYNIQTFKSNTTTQNADP
jgi:hypothetical protein